MLEEPPGAEQPELLSGPHGEENGAPGALLRRELARDLQHRHHAGGVVVGAIADAVCAERAAGVDAVAGGAEMVVVGVHQDILAVQRRIGSGKGAEDVHAGASPVGRNGIEVRKARCEGGKEPARLRGPEDERDALEVAAVAGGAEAGAPHLAGDDRGRHRRPGRSGHPAAKGIVGELPEERGRIGGGDDRRRRYGGRGAGRAAGAGGQEERGAEGGGRGAESPRLRV